MHDPHRECKPENAPHQSILLVDDSPEELAVLEASLAPLGQRLVRAHSGQEALKKILVEDFACILLDARMPGLDGRETALFIQSLERTRHVPLLFLMEDEEAGAADCVVKPVEPELLRARVRHLLESPGRGVKWVGLSEDVHESWQAQREPQRRADFEQHLVGMVSHDLRNPLNAILLTTRSLLRRGALDDGQTRGVERIQGSAERAIRMIRDLLDFTQVRLGGGILLARQRVDMHEVVRGVLDEVEVAHPGREVRWVREGCGLGDWDADRIAQVMQNLVTNALKYSPEGTPVRVESRGMEGALVLSVHNGGQPIASGQMERLFQPFQRATAEVDKAGRSVGLGLYIVKHLVDAHGGALDVRSTSEEGTTFSVRVPRKGG